MLNVEFDTMKLVFSQIQASANLHRRHISALKRNYELSTFGMLILSANLNDEKEIVHFSWNKSNNINNKIILMYVWVKKYN